MGVKKSLAWVRVNNAIGLVLSGSKKKKNVIGVSESDSVPSLVSVEGKVPQRLDKDKQRTTNWRPLQ